MAIRYLPYIGLVLAVAVLSSGCALTGRQQHEPLIGLLAYGQMVQARLSGGDDYHTWIFVGQPGDIVTIRMESPTLTPSVELYDANGNLLASDVAEAPGSMAIIEEFELSGGIEYHIVVSQLGSEPGDYALALIRVNQPPPTELPTATPEIQQVLGYGQEVRGQVLGGGPDRWRFPGSEGDSVTVRVEADTDSDLIPILELYGPGAILLEADTNEDGSLVAQITGYVLDQTGEYVIAVRSRGGDGRYTLRLEQSVAPYPPGDQSDIEIGDRVQASLDLNGEQDRYLLSAEAGTVINIAMDVRVGSLNPYLEVYGPTGALIAEDDNSGSNQNALIEGLELDMSGVYTIVARSASGVGTGTYTLTIMPLTQVEPESPEGFAPQEASLGDLVIGEQVEGAILSSTEYQWWTLDLDAGDIVSVAVDAAPGSTLDPEVAIYGADGTVMAQDDDSGEGKNALISGFVAPYSGPYFVAVSSWDMTPGGAYTLLVERGNVVLGGEVNAGQTFEGTLPDGGRATYTLRGTAGQMIALEVLSQPEGSWDPVMQLYGPDGSLVSENDDRTPGVERDPLLLTPLPETGTYIIVISSYDNGPGGDYQLIVR